jgi:hypothetical protein
LAKKSEAPHTSKMLVTIYQLPQHNIPEDLNLHHHGQQNLKSSKNYETYKKWHLYSIHHTFMKNNPLTAYPESPTLSLHIEPIEQM